MWEKPSISIFLIEIPGFFYQIQGLRSKYWVFYLKYWVFEKHLTSVFHIHQRRTKKPAFSNSSIRVQQKAPYNTKPPYNGVSSINTILTSEHTMTRGEEKELYNKGVLLKLTEFFKTGTVTKSSKRLHMKQIFLINRQL